VFVKSNQQHGFDLRGEALAKIARQDIAYSDILWVGRLALFDTGPVLGFFGFFVFYGNKGDMNVTLELEVLVEKKDGWPL